MKSYWIKSMEAKEKESFEPLEENIKTDICIIGGGLTGLSTAYNLSQYKIRTVLIEKDEICKQISGNSTAKITSQHGLIYKYLTDSKGKDFARKYYEANERAIRNIKDIIDKENIDCDFEYQPAYVFTQKVQDVQKIKDEVEAVNAFGGRAKLIEAKDIPIKAIAGLEFENQAQFNPYKYGMALARICSNYGVKIYEHTKAIYVDTEDDSEYYVITLENDYKIKAKYIVVATKYPIINIPGFYFVKMYLSPQG